VKSGKYTWAIGIVDTQKDNVIGLDIAVPRNVLTAEGWARLTDIKIN
jgi:hypothetical protein